MNKELIEIMQKNKTLKLSKKNLFWHYSIVAFVLIVPILTIRSLMEYYIFNTYDGVRKPEFTTFELVFVFTAIFFYFLQSRRLRFKEINVSTDNDGFKLALEKTAKELDWKIDFYSENFVRAHRNWNWTGSWGEMVTIIREKDRLLINSICDPNSISSVSSWGMNGKNINTFEINLKKASTQHRI
tara:strand:+ start:6950 stop:7504 length:555 start_codon:yes stop_codon:yes gene_type:complete